MSRHCRGVGRERARISERREFRAWLLSLAEEGNPNAAVLALALGHGDLIPRIKTAMVRHVKAQGGGAGEDSL